MVSLTQAETADMRGRDLSVVEDKLSVGLMDGRTITAPIAWYPRLADATPAHWEVSDAGYGIHRPDIDEDLSTEGLLRGLPCHDVPGLDAGIGPVTHDFAARNKDSRGWPGLIPGSSPGTAMTQKFAAPAIEALVSPQALSTEGMLCGLPASPGSAAWRSSSA